MRLRYIREPEQPTELLAEGSMIEIAAAIGCLIQTIWYRLDGVEREIFKMAVKVSTSDESPVWSAPNGIIVDVSELQRQAKEDD